MLECFFLKVIENLVPYWAMKPDIKPAASGRV